MEKADVENLLLSGVSVTLPLSGSSMCPLFADGRDRIAVKPVTPDQKFRRLDVVLYRRPGDRLILHRIYKVKADGLYLVGDNQTQIEGPLSPSQVRGIMVGAIRKGKPFSVTAPGYRLYSHFWMLIRPLRPFVLGILMKIWRKIRPVK